MFTRKHALILDYVIPREDSVSIDAVIRLTTRSWFGLVKKTTSVDTFTLTLRGDWWFDKYYSRATDKKTQKALEKAWNKYWEDATYIRKQIKPFVRLFR